MLSHKPFRVFQKLREPLPIALTVKTGLTMSLLLLLLGFGGGLQVAAPRANRASKLSHHHLYLPILAARAKRLGTEPFYLLEKTPSGHDKCRFPSEPIAPLVVGKQVLLPISLQKETQKVIDALTGQRIPKILLDSHRFAHAPCQRVSRVIYED